MTLKFFDQQAARIQEAMKTSELDDEKYMDLFYALQNLCKCAVEFIDARERLAFYEENLDDEPEAKITPLPLTPVTEATEAETEPTPVEPEPAEEQDSEPLMSFDELKEIFTQAALDRIPVKEIINNAGYERLSAIPQSEYKHMLQLLDEARNS